MQTKSFTSSVQPALPTGKGESLRPRPRVGSGILVSLTNKHITHKYNMQIKTDPVKNQNPHLRVLPGVCLPPIVCS